MFLATICPDPEDQPVLYFTCDCGFEYRMLSAPITENDVYRAAKMAAGF
jgi:hypothetical protein